MNSNSAQLAYWSGNDETEICLNDWTSKSLTFVERFCVCVGAGLQCWIYSSALGSTSCFSRNSASPRVKEMWAFSDLFWASVQPYTCICLPRFPGICWVHKAPRGHLFLQIFLSVVFIQFWFAILASPPGLVPCICCNNYQNWVA